MTLDLQQILVFVDAKLIIFTKVAMTLGLGRHLWDIPATQAIQFGEVITH